MINQRKMRLAVVTSLLFLGGAAAQAADQPIVTITGDVTAVSCNVNASVPQNQISLGNFTTADFAPGTDIYTGMFTVADSKHQFSVGVNGCAGTTSGTASVISLQVTGTPIAGQTAIYNGGVGSTVGTAGASLAAPLLINTPNGPVFGADQLVNNNDLVPVVAIPAGGAAEDANGASVTFTTYMASGSSTPAVQHIVAPINFAVAYN
jgi:major type 1 subunit fimbrin (pilin)